MSVECKSTEGWKFANWIWNFKLSLNLSLTHYRTQITGFGFRMIWRILQTSEGVIRTLNLHNSSYFPQSHPIIANSFGDMLSLDILSLELGRRGLTVTNSFNLVPRAFPLKNGWGGKSPGDEVATLSLRDNVIIWSRLRILMFWVYTNLPTMGLSLLPAPISLSE